MYCELPSTTQLGLPVTSHDDNNCGDWWCNPTLHPNRAEALLEKLWYFLAEYSGEQAKLKSDTTVGKRALRVLSSISGCWEILQVTTQNANDGQANRLIHAVMAVSKWTAEKRGSDTFFCRHQKRVDILKTFKFRLINLPHDVTVERKVNLFSS